MSTFHVVPQVDAIEHDTSSGSECPCGPTTEAMFREDGSNGWVIVHHALKCKPPFALEFTEAQP